MVDPFQLQHYDGYLNGGYFQAIKFFKLDHISGKNIKLPLFDISNFAEWMIMVTCFLTYST